MTILTHLGVMVPELVGNRKHLWQYAPNWLYQEHATNRDIAMDQDLAQLEHRGEPGQQDECPGDDHGDDPELGVEPSPVGSQDSSLNAVDIG